MWGRICNYVLLLLASPSLSGFDNQFSADELGTDLVADNLASMCYVVEWNTKGLGSKLYGSSASPPVLPPPWHGKPARRIFAGAENLWPILDVPEHLGTALPDFDPGAIQIPPQTLFSVFALRRGAVSKWFAKCSKVQTESVLTAVIRSAMSDNDASWAKLESQGKRQSVPLQKQGIFTANDSIQIDVPFAEVLRWITRTWCPCKCSLFFLFFSIICFCSAGVLPERSCC
jgi:hypothetical protein